MTVAPISHVTLLLDSKEIKPGMYRLQDRDDQCRKLFIRQFSHEYRATSTSPFEFSGHSFVFDLQDVDISKLKVEIQGPNPGVISLPATVTSCAMRSILRYLYDRGCITNQAVTYQMKDLSNPFAQSKVHALILNPNLKPDYDLDSDELTVSHTCGYVAEKKLQLYLNNASGADAVDAIQSCLEEILPARDAPIPMVLEELG